MVCTQGRQQICTEQDVKRVLASSNRNRYPGYAEAAFHTTRFYMAGVPEDHIMMKLDFFNAFNTLRRDAILVAVVCEHPELYCFTYDNYVGSAQSHLSFGEHVVMSDEGYQQGDPLASLGFGLTTLSILKSPKSDLRIGNLNDISIAGATQIVAADVVLLVEAGSKIGTWAETKCLKM